MQGLRDLLDEERSTLPEFVWMRWYDVVAVYRTLRHPRRTIRDLGDRIARYRRELELSPSTVFEDCNYHPNVVTHRRGDLLTAYDMVARRYTACSVRNCGLRTLSKEEATEMVRNLTKTD